jgi:hypothetical protein
MCRTPKIHKQTQIKHEPCHKQLLAKTDLTSFHAETVNDITKRNSQRKHTQQKQNKQHGPHKKGGSELCQRKNLDLHMFLVFDNATALKLAI